MYTQKLHVLVVEKDWAKRTQIRKELEKLNIECTTYENGDEAETTFKQVNFDGVLLDEGYYGLSGFTRNAQNNPLKRDIPIAISTNNPGSKPFLKKYKTISKHNLNVAVREFIDVITTKPIEKRAV